LDRRLGGPQNRSEHSSEEKNSETAHVWGWWVSTIKFTNSC